MNNRKRFILPALFLLSVLALAMKKLMVPFHGVLLIIVFDGLAIVYFMRAFTSEKTGEHVQSRSLNFDLSSIVYGICSIAILYRLQYWNGWEKWLTVAGILFLIVTLITVFSMYFFFRSPLRQGRIRAM